MTKQTPLQMWSLHLPKLMVLAGAAPLAIAFYSQLFQGAEPCILCLYQRIPFAVVIVLGIIGVARPQLAPLVGWIGAIVFAAGMSVAFYHVGVEQHWWASAASCGGGLPEKMSIADFQSQLAVKPAKACDSIDWTLFGISMATYNVVYSLAMAALSFTGAATLKKEQQT